MTLRNGRTKILSTSAILLFSLLVTLWNVFSVGLSHWDEYAYLATAEWFLRLPTGAFTIFEPPGFSFVVAIFFRLFGVYDYVAIAVSAVFASLTVATVAYFGSKHFGAGVGVASSLILLFCPLFLTYARMALTDMMFTFLFTLTLFAFYECVSGGKRYFILSSLALAACTMTKYNAFMVVLLFGAYVIMAFRKPLSVLRRMLPTLGPSCILNLAFIFLLGALSYRIHYEAKVHHLASVLRGAFSNPLSTMIDGLKLFYRTSVAAHNTQFLFFPFTTAPYYFLVLVNFVQIPVLLIAIVGMILTDRHSRQEIFALVWLIGTFILISSVPASFSRAILPMLPSIALEAALGLKKLAFLGSSLVQKRLPKLNFHSAPVICLVLVAAVIFSSVSPTVQVLSLPHNSYRLAAECIPLNATLLAETQPVIDFYHPFTSFQNLTQSALSKKQFLVVDYTAYVHGYGPLIAQLVEEHKIVLLKVIPANLPPEVYLDTLNFAQLNQIGNQNYGYIQVYQIVS